MVWDHICRKCGAHWFGPWMRQQCPCCKALDKSDTMVPDPRGEAE